MCGEHISALWGQITSIHLAVSKGQVNFYEKLIEGTDSEASANSKDRTILLDPFHFQLAKVFLVTHDPFMTYPPGQYKGADRGM